MVEGLELSDILYKPREWFHLNPANEIFRAMKTERYFADLERDVQEAGQIIEPLIAMSDGLILSGESRYIVAGRLDIARLPVRLVLSSLSPEEQERRLYMANLSRFEIDEDTRIALYTRLWPGYMTGDAVTPGIVGEIAEATGKSKRQVKRDAIVAREAVAVASAEGRQVEAEDVAQARETRNAERRKPSAPAEAPAIVRVRQVVEKLRITATQLEDYPIEEECQAKAKGYREAADMIEEALG
jgi:hypothetical protein